MSNNSRGFSAVEMMTAMAVCGFVFYLSSDMFVAYTRRQVMARNSVALMKVQQEILSLLRDEAAWSQTVALQSGPPQPFNCVNSPSGDCAAEAASPIPVRQFALYKADGNLYKSDLALGQPGYDPITNTWQGFTPTGTLCNTFNPANPDPNCPFRFTFTRQFVCGSTDCVKPIVNVQVNFDSSVLNALRDKIVNVSPGLMSQPVLARGIARVVTPYTCPAGQVVDHVDVQGVVYCTNWPLP